MELLRRRARLNLRRQPRSLRHGSEMKPAHFLAILSIFCCCGAAWAQSSVTALVTDVYDGDTFTVDAEVWPDIGWTGSVRVRNVDTPEIRGACDQEKHLAVAARDYVRELLIDESVTLTEVDNDLYGGRVLAHVLLKGGESLADLLIAKGYGRPYDGGTRQGWCDEVIDIPVSRTPESLRVSSENNAAVSRDIAAAPANSTGDPLALYDDNGNGRITCAEAGAHGIAPVRRNHPAYPHMTDGDGDGVVCE